MVGEKQDGHEMNLMPQEITSNRAMKRNEIEIGFFVVVAVFLSFLFFFLSNI